MCKLTLDAFLSYLPPIDPSQRHNPQGTTTFGDSQTVTSPSDVTDENERKPAASNGCDVVADKLPLPGDERVLKENLGAKDDQD